MKNELKTNKLIVVITLSILVALTVIMSAISVFSKIHYLDEVGVPRKNTIPFVYPIISLVIWGTSVLFAWLFYAKGLNKKWPYIVLVVFAVIALLMGLLTLMSNGRMVDKFDDLPHASKVRIDEIWDTYSFKLMSIISLALSTLFIGVSSYGIILNKKQQVESFPQGPEYSKEELSEHSNN